jgi:hypothetical protein
MKIQKPIHTNLIRQLILTFAVMCSMAFAACSDVNGSARTHATVGFQSAVTRRPQTRDNVTIGRRAYNSETQSFDRPWPFGPEFSPQ